MSRENSVYLGPRLRRLRRQLGLTQADMAKDLNISASYIALLERNQRPVTADLLLRIARTYKLDLTELAGDGGREDGARLADTLKDPLFADIDLPPLEIQDLSVNFPGMTEALLRIHTAYREEQLAHANLRSQRGADGGLAHIDPVGEVQRYLAARRNSFPALDDVGEALAARIAEAGSLETFLSAQHGIKTRSIPADVIMGALRRLDRHRGELLLDERLDGASRRFQIATQIAYIEMAPQIREALAEGNFVSDSGRELARRSLASYGAGAMLMPYREFSGAAVKSGYDLESLSRRFGASFEQVAHRLTTLQKPGADHVPFFFIRIDAAGNVSKRLDGAGFPFARHGGSCPLWNIHDAFRRPGEVLTQWIELPDGQRFFSIARSVRTGGGGYGAPSTIRAVALGCEEKQAGKLIYQQQESAPAPDRATPIGVTCRLCHRPTCVARSAPPIGRELLPEDYRRSRAPYGFSQETGGSA